ncbi:MAG: hypothetical protein COA78_13055 [Blastopirellula sp.]|nr:MAG: hypothetical protein COA78_13055 [Blastopirellula sp.]
MSEIKNSIMLNYSCKIWFTALLTLVASVAGSFSGQTLLAEQPEISVSIVSADGRTAYFGGEETMLTYRCTSSSPIKGQLRWQLATGSRTLARGQKMIVLDQDQPTEFQLKIQLPPVREGVIFPTDMAISIVNANEAEVSSLKHRLWLFHEDPFVARKKWIEELNIKLYDPVGKTRDLFEEAKIPFDNLTNPNVLDDIESGLLIIGEGVSLKKRRSLPGLLPTLADRGVSVLCLKPIDGELSFPNRTEQPRLSRVTFQDYRIIQELDKRLSPNLDVPSSMPGTQFGLKTVSQRGKLKLQVVDSADAWPWWQADYQDQGCLIVCSFGLVEHWNAGPTSRFLLAKIFENIQSPEPPFNSE